jgi:predicted aldo/keto reductase-like oxidoreductase
MQAMGAPFNATDGKVLEARAREISNEYCRSCQACAGQCAQGLPVAYALRSVMYAQGYGEFALGREHFRTLPAGLQQVRCEQCPVCTVQCPNGVAVAQRLGLAQNWFA